MKEPTDKLTRLGLRDALCIKSLLAIGNNERMAKRKIGKWSEEIKNAYVDDIPWDNAKARGEMAKELLVDILGFDPENEITILVDATKETIDETLAGIKVEALEFEAAKTKGKDMNAEQRKKENLPSRN